MSANASVIILKEVFEYLERRDNPRDESIICYWKIGALNNSNAIILAIPFVAAFRFNHIVCSFTFVHTRSDVGRIA